MLNDPVKFPNVQIDVGGYCGKVKMIEKRIDEIKEEYRKKLQPLEELADELRNSLMAFLQATGQQKAATPQGTAYLARVDSFKVEDQTEFRRHVIGTESWELIEWRANRTNVKLFEEKNKALPPGVNKTSMIECRVLAPEKPRIKVTKIAEEPTGPTGFE